MQSLVGIFSCLRLNRCLKGQMRVIGKKIYTLRAWQHGVVAPVALDGRVMAAVGHSALPKP